MRRGDAAGERRHSVGFGGIAAGESHMSTLRLSAITEGRKLEM
jgi:hypothetical protein